MIRLYEQHANSIAKIERECFSKPWSEQSVLDAIRSGHAFFGEFENDSLIAFAGVNVVCGEGYVDNVAVCESHRRQGIGEKLVTALIEHCVENSADFITLEVRESNLSAISLYEKCGFSRVGVRPNFYTAPQENAVIMTKELI